MANDPTTSPASIARRRARIFRITAVIVLVAGVAGAGLVYWLGTRADNLSDNPAMLGFDRAATQQMGVLYGTQGELIEDWMNDLKQPGTQAFIILAVAAVAAFACFQFARLFDRDAESQ